MCFHCSLKPNSRDFSSTKPGKSTDAGFTREVFIDSIKRLGPGSWSRDDQNLQSVIHMYRRLKMLRINPLHFLGDQLDDVLKGLSNRLYRYITLDLVSRDTQHPFGLPFDVHEFLWLCARADVAAFSKSGSHPGTPRLFYDMVTDLAITRVNLKDFLAGGNITSKLEKNSMLNRVLMAAEGENYEVNFVRFVSLLIPRGELAPSGSMVGPLSLLQAGVLVGSLENMEFGDLEHRQGVSCWCVRPCELMDIEDGLDHLTVVKTPCCGDLVFKECFIASLMKWGVICVQCQEDMVTIERRASTEGESEP